MRALRVCYKNRLTIRMIFGGYLKYSWKSLLMIVDKFSNQISNLK